MAADAPVLSPARAVLQKQLELARRLASKGVEIVRGMLRDAGMPGPERGTSIGLEWLAFAHAKVHRALRMAFMLKARLIAELEKQDRQGGEKGGEVKAPPLPYRLDRLLRVRFPPDRLRRYVMSRPVEQLIVEISRDLGLSPDWAARAEDAPGRQAKPRAKAESPLAARLKSSSSSRALLFSPAPMSAADWRAPARAPRPP